MFLARRPSAERIARFVRESEKLPLSYGPIGLLNTGVARADVDETSVVIGRGEADFARARAALMAWKQFDVGWVETFPRGAPVEAGTDVALLIRHLGFWSLNGCRVLYTVGPQGDAPRFGFAYGTLTNHAETGEELFEVRIDPLTNDVMYGLHAISWPQATLAQIGKPIARALQARFRRDSAAAMRRATRRLVSG